MDTEPTLSLPRSDAVDLRSLEDSEAPRLQALVDANRGHLAPWLPWAAGQSPVDARVFIDHSRAEARNRSALHLAIVVDAAIVGIIGFSLIEWANRSARLGYWLAQSAQGQGTATEAARAFVGHAFGDWDLRRVEIRVAPENRRSRKIPERLGFTVEGCLRQVERVGERHLDNIVYAMLASEWSGGPGLAS